MIGAIDGIVRMFSTAAEPRGHEVRRYREVEAPRRRESEAPRRQQPHPARSTYTPATVRRVHRPRAI